MTDALTDFYAAMLEAIDADEAASDAHGKSNAAQLYDRREMADFALRRAQGALMADREVVAHALAWRRAVVDAEKASRATQDLPRSGFLGGRHRSLFEAKDRAREAELSAAWETRHDVIKRMGA